MIKLNDWVKKNYQDYVFALKLLDYTIVLSYILRENNSFFLLMTSPRSAWSRMMQLDGLHPGNLP